MAAPVMRYFEIEPAGNETAVTADLQLAYYAGAANSEANGKAPPALAIYHCDGTRWQALRDTTLGGTGVYSTGSDGDYNYVKLSDHEFASFSPFAIGSTPSTDANLINLVLRGATSTIAVTPVFTSATLVYTAAVSYTHLTLPTSDLV